MSTMTKEEWEKSVAWRTEGHHAHFEKYDALAKPHMFQLLQLVPASRDKLLEAYYRDSHLNSIPLHLWDKQHSRVASIMYKAGVKAWSIADSVCLLKHIARFYVLNISKDDDLACELYYERMYLCEGVKNANLEDFLKDRETANGQ